MRFHKLKFYPNFTGNYTITKYKDTEYINGYFTINSKEFIDRVSKTVLYYLQTYCKI